MHIDLTVCSPSWCHPKREPGHQGCTRKMGCTRKRTVRTLVCLVQKPPIALPSEVTADDNSQRQSPLVGRGFQGPPVCLPVPRSLWAQETNKSVAQQIWILTCFAGHPSLISVSPSILLLPTIGRQGKLPMSEEISSKLTALHEFICFVIPDLNRWHGIVHKSRNITPTTWGRSSSEGTLKV